jgi:hypothetical protein
LNVTRTSARREAQWRARNPVLAAKFDRLPKAAQANIRTAWAPGNNARGVSHIVKSADELRRDRRRDTDRARRWAKSMAAATKDDRSRRRGEAAEFGPDIERLAWAAYERQMRAGGDRAGRGHR